MLWRPRPFPSSKATCTPSLLQDGDAPPGSWIASRTKGHRRDPGDPAGAVGIAADGGSPRGKTEAGSRAEVGSRTCP